MSQKIDALFAPDALCGTSVRMPYIIAEIGVNHEGDLDLALRMIDQASEAGADAVKFQTYKAERLASRDSPAYWDRSKEPTASQYALFKKYDSFGRSEFETLKRHCDRIGIDFLSTPFDIESARWLDGLMDAFKISSSDITNRPFIEYLCGFGKPIILSTGASHLHEIQEAVDWIEPRGNPLALLHCVLNYPTADEDANLAMITDLRRRFPATLIGYSDHTHARGTRVLETATLLGSRILEKHFTHDKRLPGNDHYHAMDKDDLAALVGSLGELMRLLGGARKQALEVEAPARRNARRSLVAARHIPKGLALEAADLTWKRPAHGISPKHIGDVLGQIAATDIAEDTVLTWAMVRPAGSQTDS